MEKELASTEIARALQVHRNTVDNWLHRGELSGKTLADVVQFVADRSYRAGQDQMVSLMAYVTQNVDQVQSFRVDWEGEEEEIALWRRQPRPNNWKN